MRVFAAIAEGVCGRLNPVMVKELRQAVRSGWVLGAMLLVLVLLVGAMGVFLLMRGFGPAGHGDSSLRPPLGLRGRQRSNAAS